MWLLLACTSNPLEPGNTYAIQPGSPALIASPASLDFGGVPVGETATLEVALTNEGDATVALDDVALADPGAPFAGSLSSVLVPSTGTALLTVTFAPVAGTAASTDLVVSASDGDDLTIPLTGVGLAPDLWVDPDALTFDTVALGCETAATVEVGNAGTADLVVDAVAIEAATGEVEIGAPALPLTLPPQTTTTLDLVYTPLTTSYAGAVAITSNDPDLPVARLPLTGAADASNAVIQTFVIARDEVDVLVAWDGTMDTVAETARQNLDDLVDALLATDADWRLAVEVGDDGCVGGAHPYVDGAFSADEAHAAVDEMAAVEPGDHATSGLDRATAALSADALAGCNAGLLREGARLHVVGVTDVPDASEVSWADFVATVQALVPEEDDAVVDAVAGDYPTGCDAADPGIGWYEATVATGGTYLSVCGTDWAASLADATTTVSPRDAFELSDWPVDGTVVVEVDGVPVKGWTYAAADNAVEFDEDALPPYGSTVTITYVATPACE